MDRIVKSMGAYALLGLVIEGGALLLEWALTPAKKKPCEICNGFDPCTVCGRPSPSSAAADDGNAGHG